MAGPKIKILAPGGAWGPMRPHVAPGGRASAGRRGPQQFSFFDGFHCIDIWVNSRAHTFPLEVESSEAINCCWGGAGGNSPWDRVQGGPF